MSANSKWADFRLASSLWSKVKPKTKQQQDYEQGGEDEEQPPTSAKPALEKVRDRVAGRASNLYSLEQAREQSKTPHNDDMDTEHQLSDAVDTDVGSEGEGRIDLSQVDFGPLEVFNSIPSAPMPSADQTEEADQRNEAPEAVMSTDQLASKSAKKSKRDSKKKKTKRQSKREPASEADYEMDDAHTPEAEEADDLGASSSVAAQAHTKRKRESSDSTGSRRRKSRKAQNVPSSVEEEAAAAAAASSGDEADPDVQRSPAPTSARQRDDGDNNPQAEEHALDDERIESSQREPDNTSGMDLESAAREAWEQHINGANGQANTGSGNAAEGAEAADVSMTEADQVPDNEDGTALAVTSTPRTKRTSNRKKAKPTFFDQPQEEIDAANELPSPAAASPVARTRKKAATKRPRAPKLSQSMRGVADDDGYGPKPRLDRMAGYTKGRFTDEELARIEYQVKAFAEEHQLAQEEVNDMIHAAGATSAGERHEQLWTRLFATCPDRHRQKVINITRKKFHNFVARATWTPEQEAELRQLIGIHGTAWSKLAGLINRHPEDLRDRYRNYIICGDRQRKDPWDENERNRLAAIVMAAIKQIDEIRATQPHRKEVQGQYEEVIDWQNVSQQMDRTRSRLQCITKWKAMNAETSGRAAAKNQEADLVPQLEAARDQIGNIPVHERYRLCLSVKETKVATNAEIPWDTLVDEQFRSTWDKPTLVIFWHRLMKTVPAWRKKTTDECVQHLLDGYNQSSELPDLDNVPVDDAEELQALQDAAISRPPAKKATKRQRSRKSVSKEHVTTADVEGHEDEVMENGNEEPAEEALQIDPALMDASQVEKSAPDTDPAPAPAPAEDDIYDPMTAPEEVTGKQGSKKRRASSKRS